MLENVKIKDISPIRVYVYPTSYTYEEIKKNVNVLHKIADDVSNQVIYCLGNDVDYKPSDKIDICYPIDTDQLEKYKTDEIKSLNRCECISADFVDGSYEEVPIAFKELTEIATNKGYKSTNNFRILYVKEKNPRFIKSSWKAPKYTMELQVIVEKI